MRRRQLSSTAARGFVVGLSGGVDSAVVARLAQLAAPANTVAAILAVPQRSRGRAGRRGDRDALLADHGSRRSLGAHTTRRSPRRRSAMQTLRRTGARTAARRSDPGARAAARQRQAAAADDDAVSAREQPRLSRRRHRQPVGAVDRLLHEARRRRRPDLLPIGHLVKSEVRALARELSVPAAIIERTPSAGLWIGQSDEEEMGFSYARPGALPGRRTAGRVAGARDEDRTAHPIAASTNARCHRSLNL